MLGGVDEKNLEANPLFRRLTAIIKQYEELRQANYFNDTIRALLRQPGKEFTLFREENGRWNFKPVVYLKHKVGGLEHESSKWIVSNEFVTQPVKFRIEPLMSVKPYDDPENVVLTSFSRPGEFTDKGSSEGVSGGIVASAERSENGGKSVMFTATASGKKSGEGLWLKMEKKFEPLLDLNKNQALGIWIKGDGNGELLNFRIGSPFHISNGARGDHFVKIDFNGWKYFELVEIESSDFSNYLWPDSGFYVYDSFRHVVQFKSVDKLQLWYNNLPVGKEVKCLISNIKALPMIKETINEPCLLINNEKIVFPVKMESGMYLEFRSLTDCKLYGSKGEFLQDVKIEGGIPLLKTGENKICFSCKAADKINPRVQVTVISEGKPMEQKTDNIK